MYRQAIKAGALFAALAVVFGAFGAHSLAKLLSPAMLQVFETGVRYQFYHSLALILSGILYATFASKNVQRAAAFFITGIILFSGSL